MKEFCVSFICGSIVAVALVIVMLLLQAGSLLGSHISTGSGRYTGILVETRNHGLIFKTNGAHFKTGENSSIFEDFCVLDKDVMTRLQQLAPEQKVEITYKKLFSTPSWKCAIQDSDDIITDFKVIN